MIKRLITILLSCLLFFPVLACGEEEKPPQATMSGVITSAYKLDLSKVTIEVDGEQKNDTVIEKNGRYSLSLPYGTHTISAKAGDATFSGEVLIEKKEVEFNIPLSHPVLTLGESMTINGKTIEGDAVDEKLALDSADGQFQMTPYGNLHLLPNSVTDKDFAFRVDFSGGIGSMMGVGITDGEWTLSFQFKQWGIKELGVELSKVGEQGFDFSTDEIPSNPNNGNNYSLYFRRLGRRVEVYIPVGSGLKKIFSVDKDGYEFSEGVDINWSHHSIGVKDADTFEEALEKVNTAHKQRLEEIFSEGKDLGVVFMRNSTSDFNKPKTSISYEILDTVIVPVEVDIDEMTEFDKATVKFIPKDIKLSTMTISETLYKGLNILHIPKMEYEVKVTIPSFEGDEYAEYLGYTYGDYTPSTNGIRIRITEDEDKT